MNKNSISKKCKGCGAILTTNKDELGYTPNLKLDYCQRCFRLKHYGINSNSDKSIKKTNDILTKLNINDKDWIFLINDIVNINFELIKKYSIYKNIIFVFNKIDLLLNNFNYGKLENNIRKLLAKYVKGKINIILASTYNNYGIRKMSELIKNIDLKDKIYFVGLTNSGKSSIINALIKYNGSFTKPLTVSNYLNTTIDIRQIKLVKHNLIDTPGYESNSSVLANLKNPKDVILLANKAKLKATSFQLKEEQSFILDNFAYLTIVNTNGKITFYVPPQVNVARTKTVNLQRNLKNPLNNKYEMVNNPRRDYVFELEINKKYNILISGLGLIVLKNVSKVIINTFSNVLIQLLDEIIV